MTEDALLLERLTSATERGLSARRLWSWKPSALEICDAT